MADDAAWSAFQAALAQPPTDEWGYRSELFKKFSVAQGLEADRLLAARIEQGDARAVCTAGEALRAELLPLILPLAEHENRQLREEAQLAVLELRGTQDDLRTVAQIAVRGSNAARASYALGTRRDPQVRPFLRWVLREARDSAARIHAYNALVAQLGLDLKALGVHGPWGIAYRKSFHTIPAVRAAGVADLERYIDTLTAGAPAADLAYRPVSPGQVEQFHAAVFDPAQPPLDAAVLQRLSGTERVACELTLLSRIESRDRRVLAVFAAVPVPLAAEALDLALRVNSTDAFGLEAKALMTKLPDPSVLAFPVAVLGTTYANVAELAAELVRRARSGVVERPSDVSAAEPFTRELATPSVATALAAASLAILRTERDADAVLIAVQLGSGRLFYGQLLAMLHDPAFPDRASDGTSVRDSAFSALISDPAAREPALNAAAAELMRAENRLNSLFALLGRWDPNGALIPAFEAAVQAGSASPADAELVARRVLVERPGELPSAAGVAARHPELAARFGAVLGTLAVPADLRARTLAALTPSS